VEDPEWEDEPVSENWGDCVADCEGLWEPLCDADSHPDTDVDGEELRDWVGLTELDADKVEDTEIAGLSEPDDEGVLVSEWEPLPLLLGAAGVPLGATVSVTLAVVLPVGATESEAPAEPLHDGEGDTLRLPEPVEEVLREGDPEAEEQGEGDAEVVGECDGEALCVANRDAEALPLCVPAPYTHVSVSTSYTASRGVAVPPADWECEPEAQALFEARAVNVPEADAVALAEDVTVSVAVAVAEPVGVVDTEALPETENLPLSVTLAVLERLGDAERDRVPEPEREGLGVEERE